MDNTIHDILQSNEFHDVTFKNLELEKSQLRDKKFENCTFVNSNLNEIQLFNCKFVDCEFRSCNLSLAQMKESTFNGVVFVECKLLGINWTQVKWPYIKLFSPIKFYKCNMSYSSFFALDLKELVIEECKAWEVDFREANFSNGSFIGTDFSGSLFMRTNLYAANFIDAENYYINPSNNDIRKGSYSMPDVVNLLHGFDLEIQGY